MLHVIGHSRSPNVGYALVILGVLCLSGKVAMIEKQGQGLPFRAADFLQKQLNVSPHLRKPDLSNKNRLPRGIAIDVMFPSRDPLPVQFNAGSQPSPCF
jgi:hypothetical protein